MKLEGRIRFEVDPARLPEGMTFEDFKGAVVEFLVTHFLRAPVGWKLDLASVVNLALGTVGSVAGANHRFIAIDVNIGGPTALAILHHPRVVAMTSAFNVDLTDQGLDWTI